MNTPYKNIIVLLLAGLVICFSKQHLKATDVFPHEKISPNQVFKQLSGTKESNMPAHSLFGYSISIDANFAAISAPMEPIDSIEAGAVYIYKKTNDNWEFFQRIIPSTPSLLQQFGASLKVIGNTLFIGSPQAFNKYGSVSIYEFNSVNWEYKQTIRPKNPILFEKFGSQFDVNENFAIISSAISNGDFLASGIVYIFQKEDDAWIEKTTITSPQAAPDLFGAALKIVNNEHILVSAPKGTGITAQTGVVYSIIKGQTEWLQNQKITSDYNIDGILFGNSMDYHNGNLVIGSIEAPVDSVHCGAANLYALQDNNRWEHKKRFVPNIIKSQDHFGAKVSIFGKHILIGSPQWDKSEKDENHGIIYCYYNTELDWILQSQIEPEITAAGNHFGLSFEMNENDVILGDYLDDNTNFNDGSAYFHNLSDFISGNQHEQTAHIEFFQNRPNPFQNQTTIYYNLPYTSSVNLAIYDLTGRKIKHLVNRMEDNGFYEVIWNGKDNQGSSVSPGTYIYKIQTEDYVDAKTLIILK